MLSPLEIDLLRFGLPLVLGLAAFAIVPWAMTRAWALDRRVAFPSLAGSFGDMRERHAADQDLSGASAAGREREEALGSSSIPGASDWGQVSQETLRKLASAWNPTPGDHISGRVRVYELVPGEVRFDLELSDETGEPAATEVQAVDKRS